MSRHRRAVTYAEMLEVLDQLPLIVLNARRAQRLNLREAAELSGVSFNALSRLERGGDCTVANLRLILRWLDSPKKDDLWEVSFS